ncbi:MAG: 4Fe-4S dicluster domain-containing protein [Myxococcota bacterium]
MSASASSVDPRQVLLQGLPGFEEVSAEALTELAAAGHLVEEKQDRVLPRSEAEAAAWCILVRGQVAFAEFDPGTVPKPPANSKKRITPVMQVCQRVVALFEPGDVFRDDHVAVARGSGGKFELALFSCLPVTYLSVPQAHIEALSERHPTLALAFDTLTNRAVDRQAVLQLDARAELLDVYVRQGFEYAHEIKIIQTDKCIDCDECVRACEDRHGVARIERFGPRVGLIQLTLNCRSCADARCIEVCNFEAIGYDEKSSHPEVVVYDNCVGCTKCAKACPHEALQMVDIETPETPDLVKMVEEQRPRTQVAPGEPKAPKKKKPKRIANKCDHCFGFSDMACISACPTGAIIQIDPKALFRQDAERYFDRGAFDLGWSQSTGRQGARAFMVLFGLAFAIVGAAVWEYAARLWAPELAPGPLLWDGAPTSELSPVRGFLRILGYLGAGMMLVSALYTLRLHLPGVRRLGSARTWFDFHVVFGLTGPALSLLHTHFAIFDIVHRPLVVGLWWSVFAVVLSGLVGRFFYTAIPRYEAATDRRRTEVEQGIREVADVWSSLTVSGNVLAELMTAQEKAGTDLESLSVVAATRELVAGELRRWRGRFGLAGRLKSIGDAGLRETARRLVTARANVERRAGAYAVIKKLLAWWRSVHIALTLLMFLALAAHAAISVYATGWGL